MNFRTWSDSKINKFNWVDIHFIKLSVADIILTLAKLWKPLLSLDWYWYGIIGVLAAIKPTYKTLVK